MAIHTIHETAVGKSQWIDQFGVYDGLPTQGALTFSAGEQITRALGIFVLDPITGKLLGGKITSIVRSTADGATVYEEVTGLDIGAFAFVAAQVEQRFEMMFAGADTITGHSGNDVLKGRDQDDQIFGGEGSDIIVGGPGADFMAGGPGNDAYHVHDADDDISEAENAGHDSVGLYIANYALPEHVEDMYIFHSGPSTGIGNDRNNSIIGNTEGDTLKGAGGHDSLSGREGNDTLHGGEGDDTALFAQYFTDSTAADLGNKIIVAGPDGVDTLYNIERLTFFEHTINVNDGNPLFDTLYYMSKNVDVYKAGVGALDHYNAAGWHEGRDPNAWFDTSGYLAVNKDVAAAGLNPLEHYQQNGWKEGRDPAANFDTTLYLINNPDVAAAGMNPLAHFLQFGLSEGRAFYNAVGPVANGFDAQYYLFHNPDVAAAGIDPLLHFNAIGWKEGRDPNEWFDTSGYLAHNTDVAQAGVNPLTHYMTTGWAEGRDASAEFDTQGYLAANPDVAASGINPLQHFLQFGIYEGRSAIDDGMWS